MGVPSDLLHIPTTSGGGMQSGSSVRIRARTFVFFLRVWGAGLSARSVLIGKISGAELSRKLAKVALLVGDCVPYQYWYR